MGCVSRGSPPHVRRLRHHRAPRVRSRTGARSCGVCATTPYLAVRPPEHHGEQSSVRQRLVVHRRDRVVVVARVRGPAGHGRGVRRRRRGRAAARTATPSGRAPVGESHPLRGRVRDHLRSPASSSRSRSGTVAETGRVSLASASGPGAARRAGRPRHASTPRDRDLAFVEIALVDADGNVHGEDRAVTVAVDGPAVLQGFGSGNPVHRGDVRRADARHVQRPRARGDPTDRRGHDHRHRVRRRSATTARVTIEAASP